jgi:hypothetical protein
MAVILKQAGVLLNDVHHIMRRKNCNAGASGQIVVIA